ncbi:MAG TPA: hypothetical protein GXZ59_03420 [Clostridiaceae bacterium]|nr:hypothetical protein [Clostridiaceae bacterium]
MYKVGLVYNEPKEQSDAEKALDPRSYRQPAIIADYVEEAFVLRGHQVKRIPVTLNLLQDVKAAGKLDVIFNVCTGINTKQEQANVFALLELTGVPFVGSGLTTQVTALNKASANAVFAAAGVPITEFQTFFTAEDAINSDLRFPMFVKPIHEGSALGITEKSRVNNETELREQVSYVVDNFKQPALVEGYLPGREFSVAILGTIDPEVLPITELEIPDKYGTNVQTVDVKAENGVKRICPANLTAEQSDEIAETALRAYNALQCSELARVDVRLDENEKPNIIEINTMPALEPGYAHYPLMAEKGGYSMSDLVEKLVEEALDAWQLKKVS